MGGSEGGVNAGNNGKAAIFSISVGNYNGNGHWESSVSGGGSGTYQGFNVTNGGTTTVTLNWIDGGGIVQPPDGTDMDAYLNVMVGGYSGSVDMYITNSSDGGPHDVGTCTNRANGIYDFWVTGYRQCPGMKIGPIAIVAPGISNYNFNGWLGCDNVSGNICYMELYESGSKTIIASYQVADNYSPSFSIDASCNNIRIYNINDSDYSGGGMTFNISISGTSLGSYSGSAYSDIYITTPSNYRNASSYTVTASTSGLAADGSSGWRSVNQNRSFGPCDPNPPKFGNPGLTATCDTINITDLSDPDNGANVPLVITVDGTQVYNSSTRGSVSVPFPGQYQDAGSHTVSATATSIMLDGTTNSSNTFNKQVSVANCYKATCTISNPSAASDPIMVGQGINAVANITNVGYFGWNTGTSKRITTTLDYNSAKPSPEIPATDAGKSTGDLTYSGLTVPKTLNNQVMTINVFLDNSKNIGTCSFSFDPYVDFTLTPKTTIPAGTVNGFTPDDETPTSYAFASQADIAFGETVTGLPATFTGTGLQLNRRVDYIDAATHTTTIKKTDPAVTSFATTPTSVPSKTITLSPITPTLGDTYKGIVGVTFSKGKLNRLGQAKYLTDAAENNVSATILARPITRIYSGDVSAGFAKCTGWSDGTTSSGNITSWLKEPKASNAGGGSGTQLAVLARGKITDFASAVGHAVTPTTGPPLQLTFAYKSTPPPADTVEFGTGSCPTDYWSNVTGNPVAGTSFDVSTITDKTVKTTSSGPITIHASNPLSGSRTMYIEGDVYIDSDITYSTGAWTLETVPNFTLIVHGNIYIKPTITKLDGVYIAQPIEAAPNTFTKGEIRTCALDATGVAPAGTDLYNTCKFNLTVTGSFIAKTIRFQRTLGNRKDSDNTQGPAAAAANTGEIFIESPEAWLRVPLLSGEKNNTRNYDSLTSAAPVL